ncbi:hypothetical protein [Kouleothrix sp.]|uniref:choice-of-anchor Y domain-containing protein n=1 Tax=Kouleothrix sp. TaxID=2779161 RepID=UPI0039197AF1
MLKPPHRPRRWRRAICRALLVGALLAAGTPASAAPQPLYDAAEGSLPQAQGWAYFAIGGAPAQGLEPGAAVLDSTGAIAIKAGYLASHAGFLGSSAPVPVLDHTAGVTITFALRLDDEDHSGSANRAGLSVIAICDNLRGIELGFWKNRVWAQEGGQQRLFTQAEGVAFDTGAALVRYSLVLRDGGYRLAANGAPILSGALRDYTAFGGQPDPYETPNFLFLGDNTTRAASRFHLASVAADAEARPGPAPGPRLFVPLARA